MRTVLSAIITACSLLAPAHAVTGTQWSNDFAHPYVGLIAFYDRHGDFVWRCSGSLIGPRTLLTAGHCTDRLAGAGAVTARVWFQQDAGARFDGTQDPVTGYPNACANGTLGTLCATSTQLYNYGFDDFAGFPNTRDAGLVVLDQPISSSVYGALPAAGTLDGLDSARGTSRTVFTVSGYGLTLSVNPNSALSNISYRSRLMGSSTLVNLRSANTSGFNLQTQGNGNGRSGTCSGDSGGPVFLGGSSSHLIVGVTSFGQNTLCRGTDFSYRIDRQEVLDWINANRAIEERR